MQDTVAYLNTKVAELEAEVERWKQSRELLRSAVAMGQQFGDALDCADKAKSSLAVAVKELEYVVDWADGVEDAWWITIPDRGGIDIERIEQALKEINK